MHKPLVSMSPALRNAILLWIAVALLLFIPAHDGLSWLDTSPLHGFWFDWRNVASTLAITGLFVASSWLARRARRSWAVAAAIVIIVLFFIRMLFAGIVRFAGRDFDAGFFVHLEPESVAVAWAQYRYLFVLCGLGILALIGGLVLLSSKVSLPSPRQALALGAVCLVVLGISYASTPEWHLAAATRDWFKPKQLSLPNGRMQVWRKSPLVNTDPVTKQSLWARPGNPAKNLIFLYIESGGLGLITSNKHPGLMPNMQRLVQQHGFLPFIWASSYVTIEGEANTQCGTLLPFEHGSDSMAGFDNMVEQLPCLGDVLHAAGYQQSYLGGAGKSFAGKGRFLAEHGYDKVMGLHDWQAIGLDQRPGTWGLSDVDLFDQSLKELKRLKASGKPFNLTMLTIGTHLPGFSYKECTPWKDGSERFLNAVSCTDQLIGKWVRDLESGGWLDADTVLVITGDHNFFPSPEMKRLFGDQAVNHRVLPLVVIGKDLPPPKQKEGAGFDIAPTVLDLLGVSTNARFAMGRSLLRDNRPIEYFPSRYIDIYGDQPWDFDDPFDCDPSNTARIPGRQPLSRCERDELATILRRQARAYSAPPVRMRCNAAQPVYVEMPDDSDADLDFRVSGQQQAGRFTWLERPVDKHKPGLYLLALDADGTLLWRKYAPPDQVAKTFAQRPDLAGAAVLVAAWRPGDGPSRLPDWIPAPAAPDHAGAWLFKVGADSLPRPLARVMDGHALVMDHATCKALIHSGAASEP